MDPKNRVSSSPASRDNEDPSRVYPALCVFVGLVAALKRLGKTGGREFEPRVIPLFQAARIKTALRIAASPVDVRAVFEREAASEDVMARAVEELSRYNDIAGA